MSSRVSPMPPATRSDDDVGHAHQPFGDRPGVVEDHRVDLSRGLQRLVVLEEDPQAGTPAEATSRGIRCRQPERAGTGDDQDRQPRADRLLGGSR